MITDISITDTTVTITKDSVVTVFVPQTGTPPVIPVHVAAYPTGVDLIVDPIPTP